MNASDTEKCGIVPAHIGHIQQVAKTKRCFIMVRPVNKLATELIADNSAVKGLDIHGKSSDWGPMAGYIPWDQRLSKAGFKDSEDVKKGNANNRKDLDKYDKVIREPLEITSGRLETLKKKGRKCVPMNTKVGEVFTASRTTTVDFKLESASGGKYRVLYKAPGMDSFKPVEVMAYKGLGPVTADYDLFAVCPHYRAAKASETVREYTGLLGVLSGFHGEVMDRINLLCRERNPTSNPVVRHGTELSNPNPQKDKFIALFTPAGTSMIVEPIHDGTRGKLFSDLTKHGFHIYVNKNWNPKIGSSFEVVEKEKEKKKTGLGAKKAKTQKYHVIHHKMLVSLSPSWKGHREYKPLTDRHYAGLNLPNEKGVEFVKLYHKNMTILKGGNQLKPDFSKK
jgi:hypothetical protein